MATQMTRVRSACVLAGGAIAALCIAACAAGGGATAATRSLPTALVGATSAGGSTTPAAPATTSRRRTASVPATSTAVTSQKVTTPQPALPSYPRLLSSALASGPTGFVPVASWQGQTAAWIARSPSGVALLSFNQGLVQLHLHSGTSDAGASGWRFGPSVAGAEMRHLLAAFNGAFKFSTGSGGFMSYGRVAVALRNGLGSVVTYSDGSTDIGPWGSEVPARGRRVVSVRQNLPLLIDNGRVASDLGCLSCWGATLGGVVDPARSALGITADGRLIWAGGEHLTVTALADALLGARVVRAVQLDINPYWVAGYLCGHRGGKGPLAPVAVVAGRSGIAGQYLAPWSRDFFAVVAR